MRQEAFEDPRRRNKYITFINAFAEDDKLGNEDIHKNTHIVETWVVKFLLICQNIWLWILETEVWPVAGQKVEVIGQVEDVHTIQWYVEVTHKMISSGSFSSKYISSINYDCNIFCCFRKRLREGIDEISKIGNIWCTKTLSKFKKKSL